jgi:hypothetical protein
MVAGLMPVMRSRQFSISPEVINCTGFFSSSGADFFKCWRGPCAL